MKRVGLKIEIKKIEKNVEEKKVDIVEEARKKKKKELKPDKE